MTNTLMTINMWCERWLSTLLHANNLLSTSDSKSSKLYCSSVNFHLHAFRNDASIRFLALDLCIHPTSHCIQHLIQNNISASYTTPIHLSIYFICSSMICSLTEWCEGWNFSEDVTFFLIWKFFWSYQLQSFVCWLSYQCCAYCMCNIVHKMKRTYRTGFRDFCVHIVCFVIPKYINRKIY